jgi:RNA polymerase sigma factor (sigma-70 family)
MDEQQDPKPSGAETRKAFCQKLTARLVRLARRVRLPPARAEDVAQSVLQKFLAHHPDFTGDHIRTQEYRWLLCVARHEIADAFRDLHRHPAQSLDALREEPMDYRGQEATSQEDAARALLHRWLDERRLESPLNYRLVYGHHIEGIDVQTLAAETGLTASKVSSRISAEIRRFRAWLSLLPEEDLPHW